MNLRSPACRIAAATVLALAACRKHPENTPEGTLGLLRASLVTHQPPIDRVADVRLVAEADVIKQISDVDNRMAIPGTEGAMEQALARSAPNMTAEHVFAGATTLLGSGQCEKITDAPLPELLASAPPPGNHWTGRLLEKQQSVARRLTNAFAADFRCDGGASFRAAFIHPAPGDPSLRVVWLGPSGER